MIRVGAEVDDCAGDSQEACMRRLAAAVILLALGDARGWGDDGQQARHFLTDQGGAWAQSRALWCDLAGIDESALRRVGAQVAQRSVPHPPPKYVRPSRQRRAVDGSCNNAGLRV